MQIDVCSRGFTFAPPKIRKTENPGFRPARDVLEIRPGCRRLRRDGRGDAERETTRETENLGAWGGESAGVGVRRGEVAGVPEGVGRRNFRNPDFQKSGRSDFFIGGPLSTLNGRSTLRISGRT
jgi:hypothetical protein